MARTRENARPVANAQPAKFSQQAVYACFQCDNTCHFRAPCPLKPKSLACGSGGHYTRDCTNADAKARNEAYLRKCEQEAKTEAGNERRA
ncbi:hypothetical protein PHMEG_00025685 [Phytophthora megakarya]|uniref:CCHC-type domain-containing protein n=1 Tax=Phytophthora megakarya TaxID=4795 RepID=A0A225VCP8_9STRA|nr:hypothetical protein PHMEG_00025685 [Phytophthora megakarya]